MKIEAIQIEVAGEEITVQVKDGKLLIDSPKSIPIIVNVRDVGVPGVIGPGVEVTISDVVENTLFYAKQRALNIIEDITKKHFPFDKNSIIGLNEKYPPPKGIDFNKINQLPKK